jgi:DNA-binding response OmpR family regulator
MKRVIVIDDEEDFCQLVAESLKTAKVSDAIWCSEPTKALGKILSYKPDLVILDIKMPEISGDTIAAELRANEATKRIPVLFLTALIDNMEAEAHNNVIGNNLFMAKPVKIKELLTLVRSILDSSIRA